MKHTISKKWLGALALCLCLTPSLLPGTAWAAGDPPATPAAADIYWGVTTGNESMISGAEYPSIGGKFTGLSEGTYHTSFTPEHTYGDSWKKDADQHWQVCAVCGAAGAKTTHAYANDQDTTCDTCGYTFVKEPQKAPVAGEGYTINYTAETITVKPGYEVRPNRDGTGGAVPSGTKVTPGGTLYIRESADASHSASNWVALSIPVRPAAPDAPHAVKETVKGRGDGKITGLTTKMEYQTGGAAAWTPCSEDDTKGLSHPAGVEFRARYAATASAFASEAKRLTVEAGPAITVTFDSQGGGTVAKAEDLSYGDKVPQPSDPAKDGFAFAGWYTDATYVTPWDFANGTVSESMILYARWEEKTDSVSGDETVTIPATVTGGDIADQDLTMPSGGASSKPDADPSAPAAADNPDEEAAEQAEGGSTVTITMTVKDKEESATDPKIAAIKGEESDQRIDYLEIKVEKTVTPSGGSPTTEDTTETTKLLTIMIPFNPAGSAGVTVYRYPTDQGQAAGKAETLNSFGEEYFQVGSGSVTIYAN